MLNAYPELTMASPENKQVHPVAGLRRLLVVDDNEDMRQSMKRLLEHFGYEVRVARDGRHALEMQREAPSDALITDIFMPETDGLETINQFRQAFPGMKIIAMSGGGASLEADYLSTASVVGAHAVLRKPFSKESLLQALETLAGG
jgi:CheY-like chemotaxis protein